MAGPSANTFRATRAILTILGWLRDSERVTVERVEMEIGVSTKQAREYLAFLVSEGRALRSAGGAATSTTSSEAVTAAQRA